MADDNQRFERIRSTHSIRDYLSHIGTKVDQHGIFRCVDPGHPDRTPSAKINPNNPDLWQCFGCGAKGDVIDLRALHEGLSVGEAAKAFDGGVRPEPGAPKPPPRAKPQLHIVRGDYGPIPDDAPKAADGKLTVWRESKDSPGEWTSKAEKFTHLFEYRDRNGVLQAYVMRQDWTSTRDGRPKKRIIPIRWNLQAKRFDYVGFRDKEPRPLYGEDELVRRPAAEVLVVEGEKTTAVARALFPDMVVVSWLGGTGQVAMSDWSDLQGRHITLWPDNDGPGRKAMDYIAAQANAGTTLMVPMGDIWQPKWDVEDVAAIAPGEAVRALRTRQPYRIDLSPGGRTGLWDKVSEGGWLPDHLDPIPGANGIVKVDHDYNALLVLSHHPAFASLSWDMVRHRIVWQGQPVSQDLLFMTGLLNRASGLLIGSSYHEIIEKAAQTRPVNPLADQILSTVWDGTRRVEALWTYLGLGSASEWHICGPKRWFLGLVNRVLHPGAQSDLMLILEGPQGIGKSSALKILAEPFGFPGHASISGFGSSNTTNAADMMVLSGKLLVEMSEMTAHRKADVDHFKGMLSKTEDRYRSPYGRHFNDVPRTASFAGSTNRKDPYFTDTTGGRRFVPVTCTAQIDLASLTEDRDQLYAEAAHLLRQGEQPYFTAEEEELQDQEVAKRTSVTMLKQQVEDFLETVHGDVVLPVEIYGVLGIDAMSFRDKQVAKPLIDAAMAELGWIWADRTRTLDDRRQRAWTRGTRGIGRPAKPRPPRPAWWPKD